MIFLRAIPTIRTFLLKYERAMRVVLVALPFLALARVRPGRTKCFSHEPVLGGFPECENVSMSVSEAFPGSARIGKDAVHRKVCIVGTEKEREILQILFNNLRRSKHRSRAYDMEVNSEGEIRDEKRYFLVIRLHRINNPGPDGLFFTNSFFSGQNPNSDLVGMALAHCPAKTSFRVGDLFRAKYMENHNKLNFFIAKDSKAIGTLMSFLRCIHNLHSHSLGEYFYLPMGDSHVSLPSLIPFFLSSFLLFVFKAWTAGENFTLLEGPLLADKHQRYLGLIAFCAIPLCPILSLALIPVLTYFDVFFVSFALIPVNFKISCVFALLSICSISRRAH